MSPERGASLSALFAVVVVALLLVAGLVVDGGAQNSAQRRAEAVAAQAARAGADADTTARLAGGRDRNAVLAAARQVLTSEGLDGEVTVQGDRVVVRTRTTAETTFLSLIGIKRLRARGEAAAELRPA